MKEYNLLSHEIYRFVEVAVELSWDRRQIRKLSFDSNILFLCVVWMIIIATPQHTKTSFNLSLTDVFNLTSVWCFLCCSILLALALACNEHENEKRKKKSEKNDTARNEKKKLFTLNFNVFFTLGYYIEHLWLDSEQRVCTRREREAAR